MPYPSSLTVKNISRDKIKLVLLSGIEVEMFLSLGNDIDKVMSPIGEQEHNIRLFKPFLKNIVQIIFHLETPIY